MPDQLSDHLFTFEFEGKQVGFSIAARSAEDADRRLKALAATATYDGELVETVKAMRERTRSFIREALDQKD